MKNSSGHQCENERQGKKSEQKHTQHFRKFHVVVVQNNGKAMYKKVCRPHLLLIRVRENSFTYCCNLADWCHHLGKSQCVLPSALFPAVLHSCEPRQHSWRHLHQVDSPSSLL